jgi:hypothetical protein
MLDSGTAALIAGASAIGGGVIVAASNYAISRAQTRAARKAELRRALIELYDALARIDLRLRTEPPPGKTARVINETMAAYMPQLDHAIGLIRRRVLDPQLEGVVAATNNALSAAAILAPPELLPALGRITELMRTADEPGEDWWREWDASRTDFCLKCRAVVGSGIAPSTTVPQSADARSHAAAGG